MGEERERVCMYVSSKCMSQSVFRHFAVGYRCTIIVPSTLALDQVSDIHRRDSTLILDVVIVGKESESSIQMLGKHRHKLQKGDQNEGGPRQNVCLLQKLPFPLP